MQNDSISIMAQQENPLCSNRGVENLTRSLNVDWISASYPLKGQITAQIIAHGFNDLLGVKNEILAVCTPRRGFVSAVNLEFGRLDYGESGIDCYVGFVLSGSDLAEFRQRGGDSEKLIANLILAQGKPSRVDLALDIKGDKRASVSGLIEQYRTGELSTRARNAKMVEDLQTNGETLYVGSRSSGVMLRAYNKAIETGNLGELWTRLELEVKAKSAYRLARQIADKGLANSGRWWFEKFKFRLDWYMEAIQEMKLSKPDSLTSKETPKRWWLENQVLPALRKMGHLEPDTVRWFLDAVNREFIAMQETPTNQESPSPTEDNPPT